MKIRDKVLIVEDEQNIKNFMSTILAANGFDTLMAGSAKEALSMISSHCPDLIILDLGLPDMDGMEVLKQVRAWSSVPVIVVSARTHEGDKVAALDLGADDYIEKPFGTSELLARIRTAIRHTRTGLDNDSIAQSGKYTVRDLTIDYDKHHVLMRGEDVHLTLNEFKIVALLGKYAGKVLTYDFLIRSIAWLLKNYNRIYDNPDMALDLYTRQCSLGITAEQLAIAAGTIANSGVNPVTKKEVFEASLAPKITSMISTVGFYEHSGDWMYTAGIPDRKSTRLNSSHDRQSRMPSSA